MKLGLLDALEHALPEHFRIKIVFADLEGPGDMIWRICPPDYHFIQRATRKGFLGLFRGWETVGEVDSEEYAISLRDPYYEKLSGLFRNVFAAYGMIVAVERGVARSTLRYFDRLAREPGLLAGFRLARETLRAGEPNRDWD